MTLTDAPQRALALDPTQSFIVQAPAGSGKTTLLVKRYLTLLAQAKYPENILAITFTRKAAAEMRERILNVLTSPGQNNEMQQLAAAVSAQNQKEKWNLLQNPKRLRIQTIDAFCLYLTQQTPIAARFNLSSNIADTVSAKNCYRAATRALLDNIDDSHFYQNLQKLLLHLGNDWQHLENLCVEMLERREQWLPHLVGLKSNPQNLRSTMEQALATIALENCEKCKQLFPKELQHELETLQLFAQKNLNSDENSPCFLQDIDFKQDFFYIDPATQRKGFSGLDNTTITANDLGSISAAVSKHKPFPTIDRANISHAIEFWQSVSKLLLTTEYQWRQKITKEHGFPATTSAPDAATKALYKEMKERMLQLLEKFQEHDDFRQSLEDLLRSPPHQYPDNQWEIINALLEILPLLAAQLKLSFREQNLCDYAEISMAAANALGSSENPTDLALALDYRIQHLLLDEFQDTSQAQWRLLERLTAGWNGQDGRTIFLVGDPMQSIYRFREAEVGLFLRAQHEGIGQVKLQPLTLTTNFRATASLVSWVNTHFPKVMPIIADISTGGIPFRPSVAHHQGSDSAVFCEILSNATAPDTAMQLLTIVEKLTQQSPQDTLAILVKSRAHLAAIIPALRNAGINFQAVELENLSESPVIKDLFALTRALLNPADRIAWLAILRAPWCGLELDALYTIANGAAATIWENIKADTSLNLTAVAKQRLAKFYSVMNGALANRGTLALRDYIEQTWLQLQGPACAADQFELENAKIFFELLEKNHIEPETLKQEIELLYASSNNNSKIQIMTVHKAKGLEFDHVIIPELQRTTKADNNKLLMWLERPRLHAGSDLILAPISARGMDDDPIFQYCRHIEQQKSYFENGRLLYVAITRAKKTAHLLGRLELDAEVKSLAKAIPQGSLLKQLQASITPEWLINIAATNSAPVIANLPSYKRINLTCANKIIPVMLPITNAVNFEYSNTEAQNIGTVIHKLLEIIANEGLANWPTTALSNKKAFIEKLLLQHGVIEIEAALTTILQALQTTLTDARGHWILDSHAEAKCEYEVTGFCNGQPEHFIIDRTFIDNAIRWIIDYKTGALENEQYTLQLNKYAIIMSKLDPGREIKLGLFNPLNCDFVCIPKKN